MLVLKDEGWQGLVDWINAAAALPVYSDFGWGELMSAIALRVRRGAMSRSQGQDVILEATGYFGLWASIAIDSTDLALAALLVADFNLSLRFPDAIHVAVGKRLNCTFVTADLRQTEAAIVSGLTIFNPLIGS